MDDAEAVGLAVVGGYLGQELAVADAGRGRQLRLGLDARLDLAGDVDGQADATLVLSHVEEGLVEREGLNQVGIVVEDCVDLCRHLLVGMEPWLHDDEARTEALRCLDGLGRVDAEAARLVAGRRHHPAGRIVAHGHRARCSTAAKNWSILSKLSDNMDYQNQVFTML